MARTTAGRAAAGKRQISEEVGDRVPRKRTSSQGDGRLARRRSTRRTWSGLAAFWLHTRQRGERSLRETPSLRQLRVSLRPLCSLCVSCLREGVRVAQCRSSCGAARA